MRQHELSHNEQPQSFLTGLTAAFTPAAAAAVSTRSYSHFSSCMHDERVEFHQTHSPFI